MKHGAGGSVLAMLAAGWLAACGTADANTATVLDSAGVRIVTSRSTERPHARLAESSALSIGVLDGPPELQFDRIWTAVLDDGGNIVVADGGSGEIRIFGPHGGHITSFGGVGEGPGEFRMLAGAWPVPGGSIVGYDPQLRRVSSFGADGTVTREGQLELPDDTGFPRPAGLAGDDGVLTMVATFQLDAPAGQEVRSNVILVMNGTDGRFMDTVAVAQGPGTLVYRSGEGAQLSISILRIPFSPEPVAVGSPSRIALTRGEAYEVNVYDMDGRLSHIARVEDVPEAVTRAHLEARVRGSLRGDDSPEAVQRAMDRYDDVPLPATFPAYDRLLFSTSGELWAGRYVIPGSTTGAWDVYAPEGELSGQVRVPTDFRPTFVGDGRIVGVWADELDVESVRIYILERD